MNIPDQWTFESHAVADAFDAHVREQLPWYDLVTSAIAQIARHYVGANGRVYDVGASTGNVGRALAPILDERAADLVAIDPSPQMAERYDGPGTLLIEDAGEFAFDECDLVVSMLALMFMRPDDVPRVLDNALRMINPGGALVVVERTLPPPGYLSIVTSRLTLAAKAAMGAKASDIVAKELSLAGVQRPLNPQVLTARGGVEWFRFGDFAGYVIEVGA